MSEFLSRDAILAVDDLLTEEVAVPEWGGKVLVRGLSGKERDDYEATIMRMRGTNVQLTLANARAKLVSRSVIDLQTKQRLFSDDDVKLLASKSAAALQRVFEVAQRLSGLTAEDVGELVKNSNGDLNGDSGLDSL